MFDDDARRRSQKMVEYFELSVPYMMNFAEIISEDTGVDERDVLVLYALFLAKLINE